MNNEKLLRETKTSYEAAKELYESLVNRRKWFLDLYTGYDTKFKVENKDNITAHVPYVKTLFDGVFPLLTAKLPISKVSARDSDKKYVSAKLMDRLIDYTFDVNQFEKKYMMIKKESMLAADAFVMVIWSPDPEKNYPLILHINTDDVIPHGVKLDIDDEWPIFIRRELTKAQMKEFGWDKGTISSLGKSKLQDKSYRKQQLKKLGLSDASTQKEDEEKDDLYEVVMRFGIMDFKGESKMGLVVMANGEKIINTKPVRDDLEPFQSPYANNVMPIAHLPYDPLPHSFFSQGFIDPIAKDQVELNDLENMKRSNYYRRNNPPIIVDPDGEVDLATLKFATGLPWLVKGGSKNVEPYILPDLAPSIYNDQQMIMKRMQNVTGSSDYLNPTPETMTKGNKSAAHANIMNENTKMRYRPQAVFEDRFMEKIGKLLINLWQDKNFFNEEIALAMVDEEGQSAVQLIEHSMIMGDLDFVVTSASSIAQSDTAILNTAVQIKELFAQDQTKDMTEVDRTIIEKAGFDPNKVIKPKVGMLPEITSRLNRWIAYAKNPNFSKLSAQEQAKVQARIQDLMAIVKSLQAEAMKRQGSEQSQQGAQQEGSQPGSGQPPQQQPGGQPPTSLQALLPKAS